MYAIIHQKLVQSGLLEGFVKMDAYLNIIKNAISAGILSSQCFIFSVVVITGIVSYGEFMNLSDIGNVGYWECMALSLCLYNLYLQYWFRGFSYKVAVCSAFLGSLYGIGLYIAYLRNSIATFGYYLLSMTSFHYVQFVAVVMANPFILSAESFMLNHRVWYGVMAIAGWLEWGVEYYFFPGCKRVDFCTTIGGLILTQIGLGLRVTAIFTAGTNFNDNAEFKMPPNHELVTHGVYSVCRHPAYLGVLWWSIGLQVTLRNPVCMALCTLFFWKLFNQLTFNEELALVKCYGSAYTDYQKRVGTGLPFINGYEPDKIKERESKRNKSCIYCNFLMIIQIKNTPGDHCNWTTNNQLTQSAWTVDIEGVRRTL